MYNFYKEYTHNHKIRKNSYLFLNDSTNSNEAQKYAIFKKDYPLQIESITFGWCTINQPRKYIENFINGNYDRQNLGTNYKGYTID